MPAYIEVPPQFENREALIPGKIAYSWGSFNSHDPGTRMQVTSVSIATDVATLGVTILEGYIPTVGQLVSVQGTQTATSGGAPNFNVTPYAFTEENCPGHVASASNSKICGRCGTHIDSLRSDDDDHNI